MARKSAVGGMFEMLIAINLPGKVVTSFCFDTNSNSPIYVNSRSRDVSVHRL